MGIKIKKDEKFQAQKMKPLNVKYIFAVPLLGLTEIATMMSFFMNPETDGVLWAKVFYIFFALVGAGFAFWAFTWKITSDNKRITVHPVFGSDKEFAYSDIKKVEVHKRKKRGTLAHYSLHLANGERVARVYPIMTNSGELFNRLKQLEIKMEEITDI